MTSSISVNKLVASEVKKDMPVMGVTSKDAAYLQQKYGKNVFRKTQYRNAFNTVWDIVRDPMFLLLVTAAILYLVLGKPNEGVMMLAAMALVAAISVYQEVKSTRALKALKQFTEPKVVVIRDGIEKEIEAENLVPGDIMLLDEGMKIPADAEIISQNDFSADESVITGESMPVYKNIGNHTVLFQGTTINSGKCTARVTATGNNTVLGKLGKAVGAYQIPKTLLQKQLNKFVKRFALPGFAAFCIIFLVNYLHYNQLATSLLFALTLAMSIIPEELPVAFSSFMALGAYEMSKLGIISRQPQVVENLGAVSVICLDKTGTITENRMKVRSLYDYTTDFLEEVNEDKNSLKNDDVLYFGMLASEVNPFDSMEKAIHECYRQWVPLHKRRYLKMVYEYPLQGQPPMMTHVYEFENRVIVAAKGAPEKIMQVCNLDTGAEKKINSLIRNIAVNGYRVLGVAGAIHNELSFPEFHEKYKWEFKGLIALYDPPRQNIDSVIKKFTEAKINVKILTGDYPETAINIAGQVGIRHQHKFLTGEQVDNMTAEELTKAVVTTTIFARMFPDAKLKVIEALKNNGEIVAMTGDGVNDGPALKSASIGIALGKKGTEIARRAADLILTDDDLEKMIVAIKQGRKIFSNLKKAIRYIISIHIPIILLATVPLLFNWAYPNIFTPVHIIFLELIMGPTCSVFFEREPVEESIMHEAPRERTRGLFTRNEMLISFVQGIIIATGILTLFYYTMQSGKTIEYTRTTVFTTLILSNIFLTFTNRSFSKTLYHTIRYKNALAPLVLLISATFLAALNFIPFIRDLFQLSPMAPLQFWICIAVAFASVFWFEMYKTGLGLIKP